MKLSLGFSPCPNDTFIFYAMLHGKVDTEGLEFEVLLADVEELNKKAFAQDLDITKLSYHAYGHLLESYCLLNAGSALGNNCGPLLIAKKAIGAEALSEARIAIPGKLTTANFLLSLAYPDAQNKQALLFSDIEDAVLDGRADAGLIIHENRFTYQDKGLLKLIDLGEYWEDTTKLPIPLGGIVVRRSLAEELQQKVDRVLRRSVLYAFEHPEETKPYVSAHAQEMDEGVMYQHIELYVNEYTKDLGKVGKEAIQKLFQVAQEKKIIPAFDGEYFVPEAN